MNRTKKMVCFLLCAALDALCLAAGGIPDGRGLALLALTNYFIYRLFCLSKRARGTTTT